MLLIRRKRWQDRARAGSAGHGANRPAQRAIPPTVKNVPAIVNTRGLCSLSQISCGTAVTRPANAAPAPIATSAAGRTQQASVAELASSAPIASPVLRANLDSL